MEDSLPKQNDFWDESVKNARNKGASDRSVSMPEGVMFFENLYLWEQRVMLPISGRRKDTPVDWFFREVVGYRPRRVLSVSCGTGFWERHIISRDLAEEVDAFDFSRECVGWARDLAKEQGMGDRINYFQADANKIKLPRNRYDCVIALAALHHITELEVFLARVNRSLRRKGWLFFDEYVGPNRLQWGEKTAEIVNGLLASLPERYRVRADTGEIKDREYPHFEEVMIERDPTEAVRSQEIIPLVSQYLHLDVLRPYGGAILMPLMMNIAGNFQTERTPDREILGLLAEIDRMAIATGLLPPNGAVGAARKKTWFSRICRPFIRIFSGIMDGIRKLIRFFRKIS